MMNDDRVEEMLRDTWAPQGPDGMRDRVLRQARNELARPRRRLFTLNWRTGFALAGLLIILAANLSDSARSARLAVMTGPGTVVNGPSGDLEWRNRELQNLLALDTMREPARTDHTGDF